MTRFRGPTRFALVLAVITLAGLAVRYGYVWHEHARDLNGDGLQYWAQAVGLADGKGFVSPFTGRNDAIHPPAWTLVLAVPPLFGGRDLFQAQLLAAAVGACAVPLVGLAGRRIAGARTGLIAAGIAAIYPGLWRYERALLSETLLLPLIALTLLLAYRFRDRPTLGGAAGLGLMCGLLASTRAEQILIAPLVVAPLIWWARGHPGADRVPGRERIAWLAAAGAVCVAVLAPWFVYNLGRFDSPVLLSNGFGGVTGVSNCEEGYYGPKTGYYDFACLIRDEVHHQKVEYVRSHLDRLPVVVVAREGRAFGVWAPYQQVTFDQLWDRSARWVHLDALYGWWLLVLPAVAGGVVLRRRRIPIYPLVGFVATVVITVAVTFGEPRYRVPAEIPVVLLAAVAADAFLRRLRSEHPPSAARADAPDTAPSAPRAHEPL